MISGTYEWQNLEGASNSDNTNCLILFPNEEFCLSSAMSTGKSIKWLGKTLPLHIYTPVQ